MGETCFHFFRSTVFILNLFFWLMGLGTLGIGLWLRFDPAIAELMHLQGDEHNLNLICYLLIATGVIMSVIGFLGCFGAWRMSQCMLVMFFIILIVVFCLEMAAAIFAYTHQDSIRQYIDDSMYDVIHYHYGHNNEYAKVFDQIQTQFECCGVKSYRDWLRSSWGRELRSRVEIGIGAGTVGKVPASCCNAEGLQSYPTTCGLAFDKLELYTYEEFMHSKGCSDAIYQSAYNNLELVICFCVGIACIQLFGMFMSMVLCCWVSDRAAKRRKAESSKI
uniref:Tetraspanin n=2 Tax=Panagrellus redivivus TaxID=6233 RepID=A0A7E4W333_PANRE